MSHQMTLPTTGYTAAARAYNAQVREQGHGLVVQGREWIAFGSRWIQFRLDGTTHRITWAQFHAGDWAPARRPLRKGTKVEVNALYLTTTYVGMRGKVQSTDPGDDGKTYITVDFGTHTWPFLATELDVI